MFTQGPHQRGQGRPGEQDCHRPERQAEPAGHEKSHQRGAEKDCIGVEREQLPPLTAGEPHAGQAESQEKAPGQQRHVQPAAVTAEMVEIHVVRLFVIREQLAQFHRLQAHESGRTKGDRPQRRLAVAARGVEAVADPPVGVEPRLDQGPAPPGKAVVQCGRAESGKGDRAQERGRGQAGPAGSSDAAPPDPESGQGQQDQRVGAGQGGQSQPEPGPGG